MTFAAAAAAASHCLSVPPSQTCNKCKARKRCTKRFSIQKFPQVLVLRILFLARWHHLAWNAFKWVAVYSVLIALGCSEYIHAKNIFLFLDPVFLSDLKRFSDSNNRNSKLTTYVNFPLKELDLREFASENSGEYPQKMRTNHVLFKAGWVWRVLTVLSLPAERAVYNLYAVSNHSGNALGGHYTAYCKNPALGEWYSYNDSRYHLSHHHITSHITVSDWQEAV